MRFSVYQNSLIGGRKSNQDRAGYAYTNETLLLVLCDGMGGHLYGELAAEIAIQTFMRAFENSAPLSLPDPGKFLSETMRNAHDAIVNHARHHQLGGTPGTTCVAALVQDGRACWAHAGDSRAYLLRSGTVSAVTRDHSMVQQLVEENIISQGEIKTHPDRNKITNCLGGIGELFYSEPSANMQLQSGDVLLLCSDGMWNPLDDKEIAVAFHTSPLEETLNQLINVAVNREGVRADNTTAVVARWGKGEEEQFAPSPVCRVLDPEIFSSGSGTMNTGHIKINSPLMD